MDIDSPLHVVGGDPHGRLTLQALGGGGRLRVVTDDGHTVYELTSALGVTVETLGGSTDDVGADGMIRVMSASDVERIAVSGRDGDIVLRNHQGEQTLRIDGQRGDVIVTGGDTAELFEIADDDATAGSVVVARSAERLDTTTRPYDKRVVGVISGAGAFRPGLVLRAGLDEDGARPVALAGRVACLVDATEQPVEIGDLLTTSPRRGHAMVATDASRAFGAVIGKSLATLEAGVGLLPVLVAPR